ncbi:N-acetylmuramoyl-L-alanine amidase [Clostridium botulinum]|uniref:N-acetylmuramoyl-L-alanine amidase n=1 Tax=Clostridium botulinum TaxID=1491 RepID=UPI001E442505
METNLSFRSLSNRTKTTALVLHHAQHNTWNVYDIHNFHKNEKGWSGIGYHFFITKNGKIYRGRPERCVGAHCLGHNGYTIGICAQGNFMVEKMPYSQKLALINLCGYLCSKYTIKAIKGHKDLIATDCPGTHYPLSEIKHSALHQTFNSTTYTIKPGDTLWAISRKFNTTVTELKLKNNLKSNIIYPNQILKI